jgi:hypothetical protein
MDELARKYIETRDAEIMEELYKLRLELRERVVGLKPRSLRRGGAQTSAPSRSRFGFLPARSRLKACSSSLLRQSGK